MKHHNFTHQKDEWVTRTKNKQKKIYKEEEPEGMGSGFFPHDSCPWENETLRVTSADSHGCGCKVLEMFRRLSSLAVEKTVRNPTPSYENERWN